MAIVGLTSFFVVVFLFLALALIVTVVFTLLITAPITTKAKINDPLHPNKNDTRDVPDNPEENPPNPSPPEQQPIQQQPEQPSLLPPDDNNNNGGNHHHHSSKNKDTTSNDNNIIGLPSIDKFKITENKTGFLVSWSNESYSARAFIHKNSSSFVGMNLVR